MDTVLAISVGAAVCGVKIPLSKSTNTMSKYHVEEMFTDEEMLIIDLSNVYDRYCWEHGTNVRGGTGGVWLITHCPDCVEKDIMVLSPD